jgi:hypothetical protein
MHSQAEQMVRAGRLVKAARLAEEKHLRLCHKSSMGRGAVTPTHKVPHLQVHIRAYSMRLVVVKCTFKGQVVVSQPIFRLLGPIMSCSHGPGAANWAKNRSISCCRQVGVTRSMRCYVSFWWATNCWREAEQINWGPSRRLSQK